MDLLERTIHIVAGGILGYILARIVDRLRIIEEKVEIVDEHIQQVRPHGDERGFMQVRILKDVLYLLVLVIVIGGLIRSQNAVDQSKENAKNDEIARCVAGEASRNAQRDIVDAVYSLALGFTIREQPAPPLTPEEQVAIDAYISSLDDFRSDTYKKIKPSALCTPYVTDDELKPEPITVSDLTDRQGDIQDE